MLDSWFLLIVVVDVFSIVVSLDFITFADVVVLVVVVVVVVLAVVVVSCCLIMLSVVSCFCLFLWCSVLVMFRFVLFLSFCAVKLLCLLFPDFLFVDFLGMHCSTRKGTLNIELSIQRKTCSILWLT